MKDGLYQVSTNLFCAGFVIDKGEVTQCAPILRKKLEYWKTKAIYIGKDTMQITVLSATTETIPTKGGSYQKLELAFKGEDGQVKGKKIMSFGSSAPAFKVLNKAQSGESYEVTAVKEGDFWVWTNATKSTTSSSNSNTSSQAAAIPASKSTYETAEERARKQVCIVRQSSLATAVSFLDPAHNTEFDTEDVINVAKQFEAYVFGLGTTPAAAEFVGDEDQVI